MSWKEPISSLPQVGPARARALLDRGVETVIDLLLLLPKGHKRLPPFRGEGGLGPPRTKQTLIGTVLRRRRGYLLRDKGGYLDLALKPLEGDGEIEVRFYKQSYLFDRFPPAVLVAVSGTVDGAGKRLIASHHKALETAQEGTAWQDRLVPTWPKVNGVPSGTLRRLLQSALDLVASEPDPLPQERRVALQLPTVSEALALVHNPVDDQSMKQGMQRILFDRFVALLLPPAAWEAGATTARQVSCPPRVLERIRARLPFSLTDDQELVLREILADLAVGFPMRRLLQGDVGTGKTAVAVAAALATVAAGFQVLILAPTEPLAEQHANLLRAWLTPSRVRIGLAIGSKPNRERKELFDRAKEGQIDILVGTHSILSPALRPKALGLVIVDEQHRFGVMQRLSARMKGDQPHMLGMSATPIPRTLCLALLADLKHSILRTRPNARRPAETKIVTEKEAISEILATIPSGDRIFLVFPAIDAESMPAVENQGRALFGEGQPLGSHAFGVLHSGVPSEDQRRVLSQFASGQFSILLCTQMVEVGIDIGAATLMVIFGPERFGLATLHQLRGRVGRGQKPGRCLLVAREKLKSDSLARLRVIEKESDGFRIAEEDLRIRGPGQITGVVQSGFGAPIDVSNDEEWELLRTARGELERNTAFDRSYYDALGEALTLSPSLPEDAV
ncbi:MAG TPA: helicase-related protein [Planctomycetota bacterium]|jgi:ATP-dependent DNA helicase RecG|nr:helicase-related protein [Planctomycetota bacterium]